MRAVRGIKVSQTAAGKPKAARNGPIPQQEFKKEKIPSNLGNSLFNSTFSTSASSNQNPFSSSTTPKPHPANPFASSPNSNTSPFSSPASKPPQPQPTDLPTTFAQKARISYPPPPPASKEPWPSQSSLPKPYPSYHLDADYETLDPDPPNRSKTAMDIDTGGPGGKDDDEKNAFESTIDKTFQKFADRLAQNPEQVLRYEFGGSPLLYSKTDAVGRMLTPPHPPSSSLGRKIQTVSRPREGSGIGIPRCPNCSASRVYELQLVPQAIAELEIEEEGLEGMEWGTVILGVCEKDCAERGVGAGQVGWVEEWVGVQWEEDVKAGKN